MLMKGRSIRGLALWMLWAKSSLPVPVSPVMSTLREEAAKRRAWRFTSSVTALTQRMSLKV